MSHQRVESLKCTTSASPIQQQRIARAFKPDTGAQLKYNARLFTILPGSS